MNALARASSETLQLQKYREACAQARAALQNLRDPKRKLNDDERRAIVRNVDEILGLSSEAFPFRAGAGQNGASPSSSLSAPAEAKEDLPSLDDSKPDAASG